MFLTKQVDLVFYELGNYEKQNNFCRHLGGTLGSDYTDGTHLRVPPGPWDLFLEYPENTLAEPILGIRRFRHA